MPINDFTDPTDVPTPPPDDTDDDAAAGGNTTPTTPGTTAPPNQGPSSNIGGLGNAIQQMFNQGNKNDDDEIPSQLINYNERFKDSSPTLFREAITNQVLAVLIGKNKPNTILVGPAGCGKTRIAENIARMLANNDPLIPDQLKNKVIYELPLSSVISGSSLVGQMEEKIEKIVKFAEDPANNAILFIDEIHQLMNDRQTYGNIAQILKPALARGRMTVIGATTNQEAKKLNDDPALNRRFSQIIVDELTPEQTTVILKNACPEMQRHFNNAVVIDPALLPQVVSIADRFGRAGSHRPDNAITLLDRTMSEAIVSRKTAEVAAQNDPTIQLALQNNPVISITERQLQRTALKLATGQAQPKNLDRDTLAEAFLRIKGQDEAITFVTDAINRRQLALYPTERPDTWLFAGPSGVGKTEVAKILAKEVSDSSLIILNMTEYNDPASMARIIGAPPGYVGYDSNAELPFDPLETNPYQVILLDEFEKADKSIQRLFMQVFDEGTLRTSKGNLIDFSKAIIIATTNASYSEGAKATIGFAETHGVNANADIVAALSGWFDIELLNRFSKIICFEKIPREVYRTIVSEEYARETSRILAERPYLPLDATMDDTNLDKLVDETYVPNLGARPARGAVRTFIEKTCTNAMNQTP